MAIKRLFDKFELSQELVTVSDTRKVDLSIIAFYIRYFAAQCLKNLRSKQSQKNEQYCVLKNVTCKSFELSKWQITVNMTSKQLQVFLFPIKLSELKKFNLFRGHLIHCPRVFYSKHCCVKHYLSERCCSTFKPMFENLHFQECKKQVPANRFQKKALLTIYIR